VAVRARGVDREQRLADSLGVLLAETLLQVSVLAVELFCASRVEQVRDRGDDPGGIQDVHGRLRVRRGDPYGGVLLRGRRPADQER
jgi:hypothetical protein